MDDDAIPKLNALEELVKQIPNYKNDCLWSNCNNAKFSNEIKEVDNWMFVGFLIPCSIINTIGLPRDDFFIYHDDSEYAYRILKNRYKIYQVKNSVIVHNNCVKNDNMYSKKILFKTIHMAKMPDWKMYYFIRNGILKYNWNDKKKYKQIFFSIPSIFLQIIILNRKQLNIAIKGYIHGIIGKTGKIICP